jgi:hypothetical protein
MEANEMESEMWDEGGQALQEFQWVHHEMSGPIAIRRFELEDDLAGRSTAQAFVAQGGTCDVATQAFKFLPLLGAAICIRMQANPWALTQPGGCGASGLVRRNAGSFHISTFYPLEMEQSGREY